MGGSLLSKAEAPDSSLLGHLPKEFSLRLTWCPWLVGYYDTRGISRDARKLARTPSLSKKNISCGDYCGFRFDRLYSHYKFLFISLPLSKKPKEELWAIYNNPILWPFYMGQENGPCVINGLDR